MTKAEKIFKDTYYECRKHIRDWGIERNPDGRPVAYGSLITELVVSIRTCNAVQKFIDAESRRLDLNDKYGVGTEESQRFQRLALEMTQATLDNQIKKIRDFEAELKAI